MGISEMSKKVPGVPIDKILVGFVGRQRVSVAGKQFGPKLGCLRLSPIAAGAPGDDLIQEIEELIMSVNAHDSFLPLWARRSGHARLPVK